MSQRPAILIVEDEPTTLSALGEALTRRYDADYRVLAHASPRAALEDLARMQADGDPVALVLADQWMPEMNGIDLLVQAHDLHPGAQRALLVAWGDRTAAPTILRGCAFGQLDNYLLKPWAPAEVHLYPLVEEYLADWTRAHGQPMELVRIVANEKSPRAHAIREILERSGVPHGFHSARSESGRRLLDQTGLDPSRLPALILHDGHALTDPTDRQIAEALGATELEDTACDMVVVGAGPAGLAAAVYGASEGLRTVVVERHVVGGQASSSALIRNYLGFPRGISGADLTQRAYHQAWLFGAKYVLAREVVRLEIRDDRRAVTLSDGTELDTRAVLVATGADYRRLGVDSVERFVGAGVFYTVGRDTRVFRDKEPFVAGGGNSAGQAAVHLARNARKVTLLVRGDSLEQGMSDYLVQEIRRLPNVEVRLATEVVKGDGDGMLEHLVLQDHARGTTQTVPASLLFVLVGAVPRTDWLAETLARDTRGFLLTGNDLDLAKVRWPLDRPPARLETSMPGVFAAGDVRSGSAKRVASAVGEGSVAMQSVHEYLAGGRNRGR